MEKTNLEKNQNFKYRCFIKNHTKILSRTTLIIYRITYLLMQIMHNALIRRRMSTQHLGKQCFIRFFMQQ